MITKNNNLISLIVILILGVTFYFLYQNIQKNIIKDECAINISNKIKNIENNIEQYSQSSKEIFGQSTEGGEQINYSLNGETVLIKQVFFGETGKSEISYFLENNKVLFFKKRNTKYILPISEDPNAKVKAVEIKEFYLNNDQNLCSWYLNKELQINDADTQDLVKYFISNL